MRKMELALGRGGNVTGRVIRNVASSRYTVGFICCALFVYSVLSAIHYNNGFIIFGIVVGLIALIVLPYVLSSGDAVNIMAFVIGKIRRLNDRQNNLLYWSIDRSVHGNGPAMIWGVFFIPSLILAGSVCVFNNNFTDNTIVLGNRTTLTETVFAMPFISPIVAIKNDQSVRMDVVGTSKDGYKVTARLSAAIALTDNEQLVLSLVRESLDPNLSIQEYLLAGFQAGFERSVATRNSAEVQNLLPVELLTVDKMKNSDILSKTVRWYGAFKVENIHPYMLN